MKAHFKFEDSAIVEAEVRDDVGVVIYNYRGIERHFRFQPSRAPGTVPLFEQVRAQDVELDEATVIKVGDKPQHVRDCVMSPTAWDAGSCSCDTRGAGACPTHGPCDCGATLK